MATLVLSSALAAGCLEPPDGEDSLFADLAQVDCSGAKEWAQNTVYKLGDRVTDAGALFESRLNHTAFGFDWNPQRAGSLWLPVGNCGGAQQPPQQPPPQQPPPQQPPPQQPPPQQPPPQQPPPNTGAGNPFAPNDPNNFNQLTCRNANNVLQPFDPAGEANGQIGAGRGGQFITGRCASNADCGSGACAFPCGVCSGPDVVGSQANPINGKTGRGFTCPPGTLGRTCGQKR